MTLDVRPERSLVGAVEDLAAARPDAVAVVDRGREVTFGEIDAHITATALRLEQAGVRTGDLVALELDRSLDAIACVYALWRLGAAYVPIDPSWPAAYRSELRALGAAAFAISASATTGDAAEWQVERLGDVDRSRLPEPPGADDAMAYGIFTSGTSGGRKCVIVGHRQLANLAAGLRATVYADGAAPLRVAMNGPLAFDTSVKQLVQLAEGHALVTVPDMVRGGADLMRQHLLANRVDVLDATPTMARRWLAQGAFVHDGRPTVGWLLLGGEAVDEGLWHDLAAVDGLRAFNLYGPTECTVDTTWAPIEGDVPHLGRPLPNVDVSLEDAHGGPVPDFVVGEIVIRGAGVAWGYVDGVEGGFRSDGDGRRYATGDSGRRRRDGVVEFIGRVDTQVKVSGTRIDLAEVEHHLRSVPGVADAAAAVAEGGGLVAVVTPHPGAGLDADHVRAAMTQLVPTVFVPAQVAVVDAIPMTERGKIDRAAVAAWTIDLGGPVHPGLEAQVSDLMIELVGGPAFERFESFLRRGGDSLGLLELSGRVADLVGHEIPVTDILLNPTPAGIAGLAEAEPATAQAPILTLPTPAPSGRRARTTARTLTEAIACGHMPPLDAVAVISVPDLARVVIPSGDELRKLAEGLPALAAVRTTALGRLGLLLLPCFASEALRLGPELVPAAVRLGAHLGARAASLTGDLAPATDYARSLGRRIDSALITSGQASTVAAMVSTWEAASQAKGRTIADEHTVVIGPGALTQAFADYVATMPVQPARLVHVDDMVGTDLLASATSVIVAGLPRSAVDLSRFPADAFVVEYGTGLTQPDGPAADGPCVLAGGTLQSPSPIEDLFHLPEGLAGLDTELLDLALETDEHGIPACTLAALLVAEGEAPVCAGVPDPATVGYYRGTQARLGYRARVGGLDR